MLGFIFVNFPSYILLISLAGTGHSLRCIFGMHNISHKLFLTKYHHVIGQPVTCHLKKHSWALSEITSKIKMASVVEGHVN